MAEDPQSAERRLLIAGLGACAVIGPAAAMPHDEERHVKIACFIRYQIDPFQKEAFRIYADTWKRIIPRCGGYPIGYFLPWEGTNDIGWGLIGFDSLAAYEAYRTRLKADPEARANLAMAQAKKFILREERTFVETVDGTVNQPPV